MAWDSSSRAALATLRRQGVVPVRYHADGCNVELEVLSNCIGAGKYDYVPYAAADTKIMRGARDLYAELPLGAASLGGKLHGGRALRTDYELVGVVALPPGTTYPGSDLRGAGCERATHVVSRMYLGGFAMVVGEERSMQASGRFFGTALGGRDAVAAERVLSEGVAEACVRAKADGRENPLCAVPLRVGLLPIVGRATGSCPAGTTLEGKQCVQREVVTRIECPPGSTLNDGKCLANVSHSCPRGTRFEAGAGCVPRIAPPEPPHRGRSLGGFYLEERSSSGFEEGGVNQVLEAYGPALRKCMLDQVLDDDWSIAIRISFYGERARGVSTTAFYRGVDASETVPGDALVTCGGITALWPWPDTKQLASGERPTIELAAGTKRR
jgi:hypothetical protein